MSDAGNRKIKVLIVDDSPFMRMAIGRILDSADNLQVVGTARNGLEALDKIGELSPDVVTLDVEMPKMNGLDTLKAIMALPNPIPCLMVSSLTTEGAEITLSSLEEGAVDFITKPSSMMGGDINRLQKDLVDKILVASRVSSVALKKRKALTQQPKRPVERIPPIHNRGVEVVLIGISTGGPAALQRIIPLMPPDFPAGMVVAQHMPPGFTKSMADRLNIASRVAVKEAEEGDIVIPGRVLIARSGMHLTFSEKYGQKVVHITSKPAGEYYFPSVNVMFESAAEVYGGKAMPVVMTGMGNDGAKGLGALKKRNAFSIAQSEDTCAVFGMPKVAIEQGLIDRIVSLDEMVHAIMEEL